MRSSQIDAAVEELRRMISAELRERTALYFGLPMTSKLYDEITTTVRQTLEASDYSRFYKEHLGVRAEADAHDCNKVLVTLVPMDELGQSLLEILNGDLEGTDRDLAPRSREGLPAAE